ncbi:MAG: hypothetical protein IJW48_01730 [Clostridia bacterium]|nr:hypothetical protein [Clostridia bacterium]
MTKKRIISIISFLLVAIMALAACSPKTPETPDAPVTAEGILSSFVTFKDTEVKPLNNASSLSDELGKVYDSNVNYTVFYKETKDRFNNLTETYSIYSIEEKKVVGTVSNTYADEWGWEDDFGNETYPEKLITDVNLVQLTEDVTYLSVEWTTYTPIDEEIVEEEELAWSYTEKTYYEFYDMAGALVATSYVAENGEYVSSNEYYTLVSFGKNIAIFDNEDSKVLSTYDGDAEPNPVLYDFMNDEYNYLLNVDNGAIDPTLMGKRTKIMVFDKENNLVLEYAHGDYPTLVQSKVLESGDILIQHVIVTDGNEYDAFIGGMKYNLDSFILDVETGVVTELADFGYAINNIYFADEFLEDAPDGAATTENVRNIASATSLADEKEYTIFFDNFGNVNFVFDGKLAYEMDDEETFRVLSEDRLLITLASDVTRKAVIDNAGNVVTYIPDDAIILRDYIVTGDRDGHILVYDFDMKLVRTLSDDWSSSYNSEGESINFHGALGNNLVFTATNRTSTGSGDNVIYDFVPYVVIINVKNDNVDHMSDSYVERLDDDLLIIKKESKRAHTPVYTVKNENGKTVLTASAYNYSIISRCDEAVIIEFYTSDERLAYLIDNTGVEHDDYDDGKDEGGED